jgi:HK97 family phage major capsid protein
MPTYSDSIISDAFVSSTTSDPLVPTPVSTQIIQEMPQSSAVLKLARRVTMSTKSQRQPVLSLLPQAYFVSGDTGLKQTSKQDWKNLELVAEELAVIVPIPENYLSDAQVPIWDEVRPRVAEAFGLAIDQATLFGINKPSTWGDAIEQTAEAKGNVVGEGEGDDLAVDIANTAKKVADDGFGVTGFASGPTLNWRLINLRSTTGEPIFNQQLQGMTPQNSLYGYPLGQTANGAWDDTRATLIAGDWGMAIVGLRQDISFRVFTEGVITDGNGAVVLNLMQQDAVALRATMRLGWQVANPVTSLNKNEATRYPFAVLEPANAS